jgi:hypothetical protein
VASAVMSVPPSIEFEPSHRLLLNSIRSARKHPLRPLAPLDEFAPGKRSLEKVSALHEMLRKTISADPLVR